MQNYKHRFFLRLLSCWVCSIPIFASSQNIIYSQPEPELITDHHLGYSIIGELNKNLLVFKFYLNHSSILVYDENMKLVKRSPVKFFDAKNLLGLAFACSEDVCYVIFQTNEQGTFYCKTALLNESGEIWGPVKVIDSIHINGTATPPLYTIEQSENKKHTLLSRMFTTTSGEILCDQITLDEISNIEKTAHFSVTYSAGDGISDPKIDNDQNAVFMKLKNNVVNNNCVLTIYKMPKNSKGPEMKEFNFTGNNLEQTFLKIDNFNKVYHIVALNVSIKSIKNYGLALLKIPFDLSGNTNPLFHSFSTLKSKDHTGAQVDLSHYFIHDLITRQNGSFSVSLLNNKSEVISNPGSQYGPINYPSPQYNLSSTTMKYVDPNNKNIVRNNYQPTGYETFNDLPTANRNSPSSSAIYKEQSFEIFSFDKNNNFLNFSNPVKFGEQTLSTNYLTINRDKETVIVYNEKGKRKEILLNSFTLQQDGNAVINTNMQNVSAQYELLTDGAKQVNNSTMIMLCKYKEKLAFAKVVFD